ncbi:MAG: polyphosphate kinase 1 [Oscillospiraceae bacterium]|nr:polyphosphate kinase 1 [Oscillospiraceae bacterium]
MIQPYYQNRELSWIAFNSRVLEEAESEQVPLLEQLNFSAIYQSNLDEFVQVRIGTMLDRMKETPKAKDSRSGMTPKQQLKAMLGEISALLPRKDRAYFETMKKLESYGIQHVTFSDATPEEKEFLELYFKREVKPLLSPIVIEKRQPFPFLRNKEIYVAVHLASKNGVKLGVIPAGSRTDRVIRLDKTGRFILLEDIILHFAPQAFKNYKVLDSALIRITRSGAIRFDGSAADEETDFRDIVEDLIRKRKKREPVRLQMNSMLDEDAMAYLLKKLKLSRKQLFLEETPLDLSFVYKISDLITDPERASELKYPVQKPQNRPDISARESMMSQIADHDLLLSYPYESMSPFLRLLNEASLDPDVISIKITLYRLASHSQVIEALCQAAENGKEVLVLVELRARFDEEHNIRCADRLVDAGCTVIYGPHNMKVHSKLLLITRKSGGTIQNFTQIGTGNYNEKTSRLYTDLSLMTANPEIAEDARHVFDALSTDSLVEDTKQLLVAPLCLKSRILAMLDEEIIHAKNGETAYFGAKINSISDRDIMDKLSEASQAGVRIELVVRGICCLKPGIPGYTDNIRIVSIVGRYLEHSRIYIAGIGERSRIYISSADFMTRNTVHRVEVAAPILDPALKVRILSFMTLFQCDNQKARLGQPDGSFCRTAALPLTSLMVNAQEAQYLQAEEAAKDSRLPKNTQKNIQKKTPKRTKSGNQSKN